MVAVAKHLKVYIYGRGDIDFAYFVAFPMTNEDQRMEDRF